MPYTVKKLCGSHVADLAARRYEVVIWGTIEDLQVGLVDAVWRGALLKPRAMSAKAKKAAQGGEAPHPLLLGNIPRAMKATKLAMGPLPIAHVGRVRVVHLSPFSDCVVGCSCLSAVSVIDPMDVHIGIKVGVPLKAVEVDELKRLKLTLFEQLSGILGDLQAVTVSAEPPTSSAAQALPAGSPKTPAIARGLKRVLGQNRSTPKRRRVHKALADDLPVFVILCPCRGQCAVCVRHRERQRERGRCIIYSERRGSNDEMLHVYIYIYICNC